MDQIDDMVRCRKPRGQGASRRGEILAAAKRLFAEEGVDRVTMRRIAATVGVSPTALYMHFLDKDALLAAIAGETFADLIGRLKGSHTLDQTPLARFRAGLRAYVEFGLARPDEYRLVFMTRLSGSGGLKTCALEMAERSFAMLQDRVAELIQAGIFREGDAALLSEAVWAMLHGVTALVLDQARNLAADPTTLIDAALDLLEAGLLARPVGAARDALHYEPC